MKINIAASHRFHLLDLARELEKQGHDVMFYSYVPSKRCEQFGLSRKNCHCFLWFIAPIMALQKLFPKSFFLSKWRNVLIDWYMCRFMRPCDVYIALGTVYKDSFILAKKKFNAVTILEWGSKHVDEQQRIMRSINAPVNNEYFNKRSRDVYQIVDYISIASLHVENSFLVHGIEKEKLIRNPYGVNLIMFAPQFDANKKYDVIMVGGWGLRKGCDLIVEAIRRTNYQFLHVGSLVDLQFPNEERFTHIDSVNQPELNKYYNQAKVFLLPSREEGLAMVQAQAVACNLPIVGSADSGAVDLRNMVEIPEYVTIIDDYSVDAVVNALHQAMANYEKLKGKIYAGNVINNLTWEAYGKRYSDNLLMIKYEI